MKRYKITFLDMNDQTKLFHCIHLFRDIKEAEDWAYEFSSTHSQYKNTDMNIEIELITNKTYIYYYAGQE
jgi:hypothetical protein